MKNKKLIGLAGVLALALVGILGVAGFATASDGNTNTPVTGDLSGKGVITICANATLLDASGNEVDMPLSGFSVTESQANLYGTMIDGSDTGELEGSGWITVSTDGTILDASGNQIDMPSSGVLVLDSSAVTETIPAK